MRYNSQVNGLWWEEDDAAHIRTRSSRYPGALDIEPEWTVQAASDPHRVVSEHDLRSRSGYIRLVSYSPGAGFVVTVIIDPVDSSGVSAWKTRGVDLRTYLQRRDADE
jgi:hypothetical protein